ncbi:phosphotransferase [Trinickia mobilis]|uniref:phosphotransferase n=1 Tax=Trinickia mobilis TaxID=2816356 RepID=UPI001A90A225|nr:phosphotransferase [Trinickia mobilis]
MPIHEFCAGPIRRRVAFVGDVPPEALKAFGRRGFDCFVLNSDPIGRALEASTADCVVLTQIAGETERFQVREQLEQLADLLNHDCRLYVRYTEAIGDKDIVLRALNSQQLPPSGFVETDGKFFYGDWFEGVNHPVFAPFVHVLPDKTAWDNLANLVVQNPAGKAPNQDLKIEIYDVNHNAIHLESEAELLVRRAFWNCSSVRLNAKANGLSGVGAYDAFAHMSKNVVGGDWPYRFFVKLGSRVKVSREYHKYRTTALENVPYHLGPRLRMDRCVLGRSQGLIVSDYVSGAEALRDCAREGRGVPAIGNLFNLTLLAWRRAALDAEVPLAEYLGNHFPKAIPPHRAALIEAYGGTHPPEYLRQVFESQISQPVLVGVVHGDLHATNVLVRSNDAVIIDLERIQLGMPLLYDAASLEGGLFIDGFIGDRRTGAALLASLVSMYSASAFYGDDHFCLPQDGSAWFVDSVRQIRMQARQMERSPRQYGLTLAAVLLKKACNPEDFRSSTEEMDVNPAPLTREAVRALAYVLGEKILMALSAPETTPSL